MIFIITHKDDFTTDFVVEKLNKLGIDYYRFNCEDIDEKGYSFKLGENPSFDINSITNIDTVWFRRTKLPHLKTNSEGEELFLLNEYGSLLSNLYHLLSPKKWLSHPKYVYEAENKLYQLKVAKRIGFNIPETIVTNRNIVLKEFISHHKNRVIIKPLSQGRIIEGEKVKNIFTNILDDKFIKNIDKYSLTPSIIQPYIEKEYELRVTVVNNKVFSAKIDSQTNENAKIDWRKEKIKSVSYDLPSKIAKKCVLLRNELNLHFGAIDLIKTKNGEYVFLEINPNGQWAWIEFDTGLPISDEIIKFLN
jgi:glutathione synthase/RimK-type ligase-like ATP-grasp enzyme